MSSPRVLYSIQYLRAFAAMLIVLHHARNHYSWLLNPFDGYNGFAVGVDIFFVISGFIMFTSARNEQVGEFVRRRIVRVVPMYYAATIGYLLIESRLHLLGLSRVEVLHLVQSLLFIPHWNLSQPPELMPYLIVGWTLNYEMFFYFLFAVCLTTKNLLRNASIVILGLVLVGALVQPTGPIASTYTSPLLLEFLFGLWLAAAYERVSLPNGWFTLPIGVAGLFFLPISLTHGVGDVLRGIFATLIVAGALSAERHIKLHPILKALGDGSYSIYLTHLMVLTVVAGVWKHLPIHGWIQTVGYFSSALVCAALVGFAVHRMVERPLLRRLSGRRAVAPPVAAA